jgi:hypothetical protein
VSRRWIGDSFATDFDWGRFDRLIDVGGSRGSKALAILQRHPSLKASVVDRASVVRDARRHGFERGDPGPGRASGISGR